MTRIKLYLAAFFALVLAYFGKQTYDRKVGADQNERERKQQDIDAARKVGEAARDARRRAADDQRDPVDRVRGLGGLRDGGSDRGGTE